MGLSSNSLIHLTDTKEALKGILSSGFKINYCFEDITFFNGKSKGAYPMVSFSDIPLSQLKEHIDSYGKYGIGLKKEWAKTNRLNPVLYIDNASYLSEIIGLDFKELLLLVRDNKIDKKYYNTFIQFLSYTKNYEGKLKTRNFEQENYRFSDEREWRYVPNAEVLGDIKSWINSADYSTKAKKRKANRQLEDLRLNFTPNDINYIFVKDESEISEIIEALRDTNKNNPLDSVERLMSRIMTTNQIMTDI